MIKKYGQDLYHLGYYVIGMNYGDIYKSKGLEKLARMLKNDFKDEKTASEFVNLVADFLNKR